MKHMLRASAKLGVSGRNPRCPVKPRSGWGLARPSRGEWRFGEVDRMTLEENWHARLSGQGHAPGRESERSVTIGHLSLFLRQGCEEFQVPKNHLSPASCANLGWWEVRRSKLLKRLAPLQGTISCVIKLPGSI